MGNSLRYYQQFAFAVSVEEGGEEEDGSFVITNPWNTGGVEEAETIYTRAPRVRRGEGSEDEGGENTNRADEGDDDDFGVNSVSGDDDGVNSVTVGDDGVNSVSVSLAGSENNENSEFTETKHTGTKQTEHTEHTEHTELTEPTEHTEHTDHTGNTEPTEIETEEERETVESEGVSTIVGYDDSVTGGTYTASGLFIP